MKAKCDYRFVTVFNFIAAVAAFAASLLYASPNAEAVPAFARQTGQECSMCHIGSFGPQLTAYGRNFKLYGYLWGEVKNPLNNFSTMAFGGMEHTQEGLRQGIELTGTLSRFSSNNNWTPEQVSIFYGGRITDNIGMLAQAT